MTIFVLTDIVYGWLLYHAWVAKFNQVYQELVSQEQLFSLSDSLRILRDDWDPDSFIHTREVLSLWSTSLWWNVFLYKAIEVLKYQTQKTERRKWNWASNSSRKKASSRLIHILQLSTEQRVANPQGSAAQASDWFSVALNLIRGNWASILDVQILSKALRCWNL